MTGRGDRNDDDEIDDASLRSMRSVWLSMRDEDPPAAGMSALMAAAAAKATELRAERPSWWQRAFAQLRRPPALAFATVMILIGGAVLVTRNQDDMKVDEKAATPELRVQDRGVEEPPTAAPVTSSEIPAPEPAPVEPPKEVKQRPKPKPAVKAKDEKMTFDGDRVGPNEPSRDRRFESTVEEKPSEGKSGTKAAETVPGMVGGSAPDVKKPAPPPSDPHTGNDGETVTLSDSSSAKPQTPPNEQLARQAESAASRGDCPAVRTIVARLRKQDDGFYKSRLGKNAAVTKCL